MELMWRLLLLCAVACEVWDTETKPEDFVCSRAARKALNIGPELEIALCVSSTILSTSFQLPCTQLHVATWETKSDKEKQGDVVASLRLLIEGVRTLRTTAQAGCETVLLQRLENNIQNHLLILTHLQLSVRSRLRNYSHQNLKHQSSSKPSHYRLYV
uniref:Thrombopoietin n=1 Tax=Nothobranchius furzeri TaxID=105023 RepID=A0A8C6LHT6_NOTFU